MFGVNETLVEEVASAIQRGWALTPLNGKKAFLEGWTNGPPAQLDEIQGWVFSGHNIGVRTGRASGIIVVDYDETDEGFAEEWGLPPCPTVITGSGKRHFFFKAPAEDVISWDGRPKIAVELKGKGKQVVLAGSIHPETRNTYRWEEEKSPEDVELPPYPAKAIERLKAHCKGRVPRATSVRRSPQTPSRGALGRAESAIRLAEEGTRNNTLNREAFRVAPLIGRGAYPRAQVEKKLLQAALASGLTERESEATIASGLDAGLDAAPVRQRNDTGNADLLVEMYGDEILYCGKEKKWYTWNGRQWEPDYAERMQALAKTVAVTLQEEARAHDDDDHKGWKWAVKSANAPGLGNMATVARDLVPVSPDEFDQAPWLLNVANGTIDLHTGELQDHNPADKFTKISPVEFDPKAECPRWDEFLREVVPDSEVRRFLQRAVGCSLVGEPAEHALFFLHGDGANGKSTFLGALQAVLGRDYAIQAAPKLLLKKDRDPHTTDLVDLRGTRLVICSEIGEGQSFNEELVKQLTGGDAIRGRRLYENNEEFNPSHQLWIAANTIPTIVGTDEAIWRRFQLIPFTVCVPEGKRDAGLPQKLREELSGILNWAIRGCLAWQRDGLLPPEAVRSSSQECRKEMDTLGRFLDERVVKARGETLSSMALYEDYKRWCEEQGIRSEAHGVFAKKLKPRGFTKRKTRGVMVYDDIRLASRGVEGGRGGISLTSVGNGTSFAEGLVSASPPSLRVSAEHHGPANELEDALGAA